LGLLVVFHSSRPARRHCEPLELGGLPGTLLLEPPEESLEIVLPNPEIFKAYDVRGVYPSEIDATVAWSLGVAFSEMWEGRTLVVAHDCRVSSPELEGAFVEGATSAGSDVVRLGLASTDMLYFASGKLELPGAVFTASHNPPEYNGIKFCGPKAAPISEDTGLAELKNRCDELDKKSYRPATSPGKSKELDMLSDYAEHCRSFIDQEALQPSTVVVDAANGMAGLVVPAVFDPLPVEIVPLYFELDGTFPNHPPDPIQPENLADLRAEVLKSGALAGLAFDGDADRVFIVDDEANPCSGSLTTALVAKGVLKKHPGEKIIYNLICSRAVPEIIEENGGIPVRTRVGHSFIKKVMAETGAYFGGEHSGHYYFRDNFRADSGIIAALVVLEQISLEEKPLSELRKPLERYFSSGEINTSVEDPDLVLETVSKAYSDADQDWTDGLTISYPTFWFNLRPSNTEPLLRLNMEAESQDILDRELPRVMEAVRG
jgi:phosphomannomutase